VVNKGATIESGGQMVVGAAVLKNENADFKSKVEQKGDAAAVTEYFVNGKTYVKKDDEVYIQETGWDGHWEKYLVTPDGKFNHYSSYEYLKTDYTTKTVSSDPAMIRSGGSLSFDFNQASNIDSVVISGDTARLNQDPTHAENFGFINHASTGEDYHTQSNNKYFNHVTADRRRRDNPLSKRPYTYKNLVKEVDQPQKVLHSEYQLPILGATINTTPSSTGIDKPATGDDVSTIIEDVNDDTITLPTSALYIINADDPNQPLIQTDPAFTDYKQWLSSDYMLKALQSDPNHIHKRLSDGYGEQARIKDQYYHLTGRHINTDYSSNEEAYKALMDNGITAAKAFGYTLGTALTAEQMANLTTDIVWLVKQPITVVTKDKDGNSITKTQDVLVPKLYLRSANIATGALTPDGRYAAMSGKNMDIQLTGNLDNNGNIIAKDTVNINANNVTNDGGIYGNFVAVTADNTIANHGTLHANSAMSLDAGNNLINQSQTTTQTNTQGQSASSNTAITRIATIRVGDGLKDQTDDNGNPLTTLNIQAGNYVLNKAANIQNDGGNTQITAQNGINITTLTTSNHISAVADPNNYFNHSQSTDVGSTITSAG
ncbi:S-layer family protein, partial [Moraxella porci]